MEGQGPLVAGHCVDLGTQVGVSVRSSHERLVEGTTYAGAAAMADRVLFLADGQIVDEMSNPDADRILDRIKAIGG